MKKSVLFKVTAIAICIFMLGSIFVGCNKDNTSNNDSKSGDESDQKPSKTINFWFWNPDEGKAFKDTVESNTDLEVKMTITNNDSGGYVQKLETNVKAGKNFADVAAAEAGFVKRVIEMPGAFDDISQAPYNATDDMAKLVQYAADIGKDSKGVQRLVATQATPCGMIYKRALAKAALGTDDPEEIEKMFANPDAILDTAQKLLDGSDNKTKIVAGPASLLEIYLGGRTDPWVKDNKFVIDPSIDEYLDLMKKLRDMGADAKLDDWTEGWNASFNDDTTFAYAAPPWFPTYIVKPKVEEEKNPSAEGGWAVVKGPKTSYWGGTYLGVLSKSTNKENAWKFVKAITLDEEIVKKRITREGAAPDFTANMAVNNELAKDDKQVDKMLNQNFFAVYNKLAEGINGKLQTNYDDVIKDELNAQIKLFLDGKKDKETMLKDFVAAVKPPLQAKGVQFDE